MGWVLRIVGIGLTLAGAVYASREYSAYLDRKIRELERAGADVTAEREAADKNRRIATALLVGGALALIVMIM